MPRVYVYLVVVWFHHNACNLVHGLCSVWYNYFDNNLYIAMYCIVVYLLQCTNTLVWVDDGLMFDYIISKFWLHCGGGPRGRRGTSSVIASSSVSGETVS